MEDRIIVALDADEERALELADSLRGHASWVKVGMTLYYGVGPSIVAQLKACGFRVFVDLKLHDIPHQVAGAAATLTRVGADIITVHASGGSAMLRAAVDSACETARAEDIDPPAVIAVTVLTSLDDAALAGMGVPHSVGAHALGLAQVARDAGCHGVVCSPHEAERMRALLGPDALIVTPGVRPVGTDAGDQARVATPRAALDAGASHLVIGRPITAAADPAAAFDSIAQGVQR